MFNQHGKVGNVDDSFDSDISEPRIFASQIEKHTMCMKRRPSLAKVKGVARFKREELDSMRAEILEQ